MLAGPAGVALRHEKPGQRLAPLPADAKSEDVGYQRRSPTSRRGTSLDLDACTKCGKCHEACPARASGYPLSPRDLILDLREVAEGSLGIRAALGRGPLFDVSEPIARRRRSGRRRSGRACSAWPASRSARSGSSTSRSSTSCAASSSSAARWTRQLQSTLETIYTSGNSFGEREAQAGALGEGARLRAQGRAQGAGRRALVRRRLRVARPAQPAQHPGARAHPPPAGVDVGILFDGGEDRRQRRAPRRRGRALHLARRGEHRDDRGLRVQPHPDERPALLQHAQERVPGARRPVARRTSVVHHSELLLELLDGGAIVP